MSVSALKVYSLKNKQTGNIACFLDYIKPIPDVGNFSKNLRNIFLQSDHGTLEIFLIKVRLSFSNTSRYKF